MTNLFVEATKRHSLRQAWYRIRANGIRSPQKETREAIDEFERDAESQIARVQRQLRNDSFFFEPQTGVRKKKRSGGKRGIVMAPIQNRIVERAWLNCLQKHVPFVRNVIQTPTSVGGVPDRSVPHGLLLIRDAMREGKKCFVRADISGFFDGIPRRDVICTLGQHIDDGNFLKTLEAATEVTLANEKALGEDRKLFPTDREGVAQGSPLSALFGNILLHKFDKHFNDRGIVCVRFIDDFIMLGERQRDVRKAFENAIVHLEDLGLKCHDPFNSETSQGKAQYGLVESGFVFLGYDIRPSLVQPSKQARKTFLNTLDRHLRYGREAILEVLSAENSLAHRQRYVQTLALLDRVIRGWGNSFAYSNATATMHDLDKKIERKIKTFRDWYQCKISGADWQTKRRTGGVCLLIDIKPKSLDELPFRLGEKKRHRRTKGMIIVSTDGSVIGVGPRAGRDKGPGGWGVVFHSDGTEVSGYALGVTNNEMELAAVIEALKRTSPGSRVKIRTDSQYVSRAVQENAIIRSNTALWDCYKILSAERQVDVVWIKGHAGDRHNERANELAQQQASYVLDSSKAGGWARVESP